MGPERRAVWVSGRSRRGLLPFCHKEAPASELELGVRATLGRGWMESSQEVLGGHRKGMKPAWTQDKQHGVREGV